MALRPEYALGHSLLNDFLFAVIGEESTGQELTMLSALSRMGLNPWEEAARLAEMPRQDAASALAEMLGRLPDSGWAQDERSDIAARLVMGLPEPGTRGMRTAAATGADSVREAHTAKLRKLVFWACFAAAVTVAVIGQFAG